MRDEIAEIIKKKTTQYDNAYWMCADEILALLKERVEKAILTDEEAHNITGVIYTYRVLIVAHAQLTKVLEVLK